MEENLIVRFFWAERGFFTVTYQSSWNFCYKLKIKWWGFFPLKELSVYKDLHFSLSTICLEFETLPSWLLASLPSHQRILTASLTSVLKEHSEKYEGLGTLIDLCTPGPCLYSSRLCGWQSKVRLSRSSSPALQGQEAVQMCDASHTHTLQWALSIMDLWLVLTSSRMTSA